MTSVDRATHQNKLHPSRIFARSSSAVTKTNRSADGSRGPERHINSTRILKKCICEAEFARKVIYFAFLINKTIGSYSSAS
jgi:hypothetical protein